MNRTRRVALFPTCVVDTVASGVGIAAVRVLRKLGYIVEVPPGSTCCGQPAWNSGFTKEAAAVAKTTLAALEAAEAEVICAPAGSCATMMTVYWPELFETVGDTDAAERARRLALKVKEFSALVAQDADRIRGSFEGKVAYHHSCHMLRELRIHDEPVGLLNGLNGCEVAQWAGDDRCCGFGGMFSVKLPEVSVAMADEKIDGLKEADPDVLVGCDQSCLMHMRGRLDKRGESLPSKHLAEVLDEAMTE